MFVPDSDRYKAASFRRCGNTGLNLPPISLGLWQNFGEPNPIESQRAILRAAFDRGVTHFDLANNYGPPPGSAETNFGQILREDFNSHRDELIISSKAGYDMWPGPYGDGGSRKYLLASLDQSLARTGLDYFDLFYSHRYDPDTPLHETIGALHTAVQSGRALYVGISSYNSARTREAVAIARDLGTPLVIHQPSYSMLNRWIEEPDWATESSTGEKLTQVAVDEGMGIIAFSPLAQGMLTAKYLDGIPKDSRAARQGSLRPELLTPQALSNIRALNELARERGQTLPQLALAWVLRDPAVTSALIGASSVKQLHENLDAVNNLTFCADELAAIDEFAADARVNIWGPRSSDH